jgi:hypothetical protein
MTVYIKLEKMSKSEIVAKYPGICLDMTEEDHEEPQ